MRESQPALPGHSSDEDDEISLVDLAAVLWRRKLLIVGFTIIAAILSVLYAVQIPNSFSAQTVILPIAQDKSSSLSQYAGLAAMAGINLPSGGTASPTSKIMVILKSRTLAERLVDKLGLVDRLREKSKKPPQIRPGQKPVDPRIQTIEMVQKGVFSASIDDKSAVMRVSAVTRDPELSRDIANGGVEILGILLNEKALTVSSKSIQVLQDQTVAQEKKVRSLQAKLSLYQKKTNVIQPEGQLTATLSLYQGLITQKIATEIELERLQSALSSDNTKVVTAKAQLAALQKQINSLEKTGLGIGPSLEDAPDIGTEYMNIKSELELAARLYGVLLASYENAKLQKNDDQLFVEVIDPAIAPTRKSAPSRAMICVVGTMAGAFFAILLCFVLDAFVKISSDPEIRAKFATRKKLKSQPR
jgi:uncharacterized protein involved in exopolysaccharide biosynthesis